MRLRCPNCRTNLDIVPAQATIEVKCPSCGSMVDISGSQETIEYRPPKLGQLAHFQLIEHIGRGHFGDVYKANDTRLERVVAVKVPRTGDLGFMEKEAFFREARTAARLRHPNIVTIHDVSSSGETIYIASEFIAGVNLADRICGKPLAPQVAAGLAAKIAEALQHAHEQGVIHRDLKPRNIMLDAQGEPHLLDFGLAKRDATDFTITTAGEILGTPAYMAPEQARGDAHSADARSDVYSLGVTLYEMLTGARPFHGDARGLIFQVLNDDPASPRKLKKDIPRDLETICLKAMAKEPSRRYQTAGDMAADLKRFLAGDAIHARRAGAFERGWRWCRKNPAWCAAGGLGTAALVLLGVMAASAGWSGPPRRYIEMDVKLAQGTYAARGDRRASAAKAVFWRLDRQGNPLLDSRLEVTSAPPLRARLEPGEYLIAVIEPSSGRFHEILRHVPDFDEATPSAYYHRHWEYLPGGRIKLPRVLLPLPTVSADMASFVGGDVTIGSDNIVDAPPHAKRVKPFLIDTHEVSIRQFREIGLFAPPEEVASEPVEHPVRYVSYDEALACAEACGKRLPSEAEYEFAATNGGLQEYPWGDEFPSLMRWPMGPVNASAFDETPTTPPVIGLYSNAAEWTCTWMQFYPAFQMSGVPLPFEPRDHRVVRGAPQGVIDGNDQREGWEAGPRQRVMCARTSRKGSVGFRMARSESPRLVATDFEAVLKPKE